MPPTTEEILNKYARKIESEMGSDIPKRENYSQEYKQFKQNMLPDISRYKRWTDSLGNAIKIKLSQKI